MRTGFTIIALVAAACLCCGFVSTNVPLGHWSYEAVDKLIGQGFIPSSMMTTRPVSRLEMGRCVAEAIEKAEKSGESNEIILSVIARLKEQFHDELMTMGILEGVPAQSFIKPVEDPYFKYVYGDKAPDLENQRGDVFNRHSNYRVGFASRMKFWDTAAFYFHPEYAHSSPDPHDIDLIEGYGKAALGRIEIEVGKDLLWWGPGYHGSIIMSNNVEPFKMIKVSNPQPILLPWIFSGLGPFKAVWFLTELEEHRHIAEAKLTGLRLNFKPHPVCEIGLSRAIMFGGAGVSETSLSDYVRMWQIKPEQRETNQLAGLDVSVLLPLDDEMPARSLKLYGDLAGEDEAGALPAKWGELFGMQVNDILRTGRTDLRVEYANNHISGHPNVFYTHTLYQSGYTYKDRIIGHHMGTDSRDLFVRVTHYVTEDAILGLEYDRQEAGLSSSRHQTMDQLGLDLTFFTTKSWRLRAGYRYENDTHSGSRDDNHIFHLLLIHDF